MKNSEFNNKHKNKEDKLKNIISNWYFKHKRFLDGGLLKQNPDYVHMKEFTNGELTTRKLILQW